MPTLVAILALGSTLYGLRLSGFALARMSLPSTWEGALRLLPVSLLAALTASLLTGGRDGRPERVLAAAVAAWVAARTGRVWACILAGLGIFWIAGLAGR